MRHATYFIMCGFGKQWLFFVFSIMLIESVSKCISKFETQSIYNKKIHKHVINHLQLVSYMLHLHNIPVDLLYV